MNFNMQCMYIKKEINKIKKIGIFKIQEIKSSVHFKNKIPICVCLKVRSSSIRFQVVVVVVLNTEF